MKLRPIILSLILGLAAGVLLLEVFYGGWFDPYALNRLNIVRNKTVHYPINGLYDTGLEYAVHKRDMYGFRGYYESPDSIDILTIGGSTTEQKYITEGQTWQDVMRTRFLEEGKDVSVVNAGLDGQSSKGHIENFEYWFPKVPGLKPKYFIFYIGFCDRFAWLDRIEEYKDRKGLLGGETERSMWDRLLRRSFVCDAFRKLYSSHTAYVYDLHHARIDYSEANWLKIKPSAFSDHVNEAAKLYGRQLHRLFDLVESWGGKAVFVTQKAMTYKEVEGEIYFLDTVKVIGRDVVTHHDDYIYMSHINNTTMEVCRERGGICIDLAKELEVSPDDYYDYRHMNPRGTEKVGNFLYGKLKELF